MNILLATLVTLALLIFSKLVKNLYDYYVWRRKVNKIPGPQVRFPIIGASWELIRVKREDKIRWLHNIAKRYQKGIFKIWIGLNPAIQINTAELAEVILRSTKHIEKSMMYEYLEPWLGKGLLTSTGDKWYHDRKLITPAFHFGILEDFAEVMVEKAHILNRLLNEQSKFNGDTPFDIFDMICHCALDIICETAMGVNVDAQNKDGSNYTEAIQCISTEVINRLVRPWLRPDFIYYRTKRGQLYKNAVETIHRRCTQVIEQKQSERREKMAMSDDSNTNDDDDIDKVKRRAFLDLLLEASETNIKPLTIEEIRDQVNTFMFAGHDTTAALMSWCLFSIGNDEKVQNSIHQELDQVFGDSNEPTTTKQVSQLKYLDRVIKETLRLYPSATTISRKISDELKMGEYTIPPGCTLTLQIYQLHRDPKHWPNPTEFNPDRFLPENTKHRHPYAYIPFSGGLRNCIGQKYAMLEAKIVLTEILRKWKVKSRDTHESVKAYNAIILRPHEGIFLNFYPKKSH